MPMKTPPWWVTAENHPPAADAGPHAANDATVEVTLKDERLVLLPQRAAWWERAATLIVADTHFGKPASFRAAGIPVPETVTGADLDRLSCLFALLRPRRLLILGDFLHAAAGRSAECMDQIAAWRRRHEIIEIVLVRGNHDIGAGDPPDGWNICVEPGPRVESGFTFCHAPCRHEGSYTLCGHVHPGVALGAARSYGAGGGLRAACFWFGREVGILPAFGSFTGLGLIRPRPGDQVFAVGDGEVVQVRLEPARAG